MFARTVRLINTLAKVSGFTEYVFSIAVVSHKPIVHHRNVYILVENRVRDD